MTGTKPADNTAEVIEAILALIRSGAYQRFSREELREYLSWLLAGGR
jgi:hypothetical protein